MKVETETVIPRRQRRPICSIQHPLLWGLYPRSIPVIIQRYIVRYEHCDAWCLYDWESPDKISYVSRPVKHGQSHSLLSKKILANSGQFRHNLIPLKKQFHCMVPNRGDYSCKSPRKIHAFWGMFTCAFVPPSIGTTTRSASNMEVERPVGATLG